MPRALCGVDCEECSGLPRDLADLGDRLNDARHVGNVLNDDESSFRSQRSFDVDRVDSADVVYVNRRDRDAARSLKLAERSQDGVVLGNGGDHVIALAHCTVQDRVEAVGAVERENNLVLRAGSQQLRRADAATVNGPLKLLGGVGGASSDGAAIRASVLIDGVVNAVGLRPAGSRIVEIQGLGRGHGRSRDNGKQWREPIEPKPQC